jgi:RNAse (barnase) inhibitor barstar
MTGAEITELDRQALHRRDDAQALHRRDDALVDDTEGEVKVPIGLGFAQVSVCHESKSRAGELLQLLMVVHNT